IVMGRQSSLGPFDPQMGGLFAVGDADKTGLMSVTRGLDPALGLDLILHTPGGDTTATESLIVFLRNLFGIDIRVIVPQLAMSAGTMIACAAREIVMGRQSSLGPFDPQMGGIIPARAIREEFARAARDITANPALAELWRPILAQYSPGLVVRAERAIEMADEIALAGLTSGMFLGRPDAEARAQAVVRALGSFAVTKTHGRHLERGTARTLGLEVADLEADPALEESVLSLYYACVLSFQQAGLLKIIENHLGESYPLTA
ncbi:MAG: hypothetical protein WCF85_20175, partial [Rhodospirillaceae bacterium]